MTLENDLDEKIDNHVVETFGSVDKTLNERGKRYGSFKTHAEITQNIKSAMQNSPNWLKLSPDKIECLDMIAHKIGRILNGDPEYSDSWHDIAGYATLVEKELNKKKLTEAV